MLLMATAALVAAGCSALGATTSPIPVPVPVTTPGQAIERVVAGEPRLTGIAPRDPNAIGQPDWYDVEAGSSAGTFLVTTRVGWGDCPSRCVNEHVWKQAVGADGTVNVISEAGPPIPEEAWPDPTAGKTGIKGSATAGPTCPVERLPPDTSCARHPVQGAVIVVRDASGAEVDRTVVNAAGTYFSAVAAGTYVVEPQPVGGILGTPQPQQVVVTAGQRATADFAYDTGIR
jgi:hypothetical protein